MTQPSLPSKAEECLPGKRLDGDQFAFEFQKAYGRLWTLAVAILGDKHQAEDVVQDAAIVAMSRLEHFEPGTNFAAWMSTIVRFQAFNRSRKRVRQRTQSVDPIMLDNHQNKSNSVSPPIDPRDFLPSNQTFFDDAVLHALNDIEEIPRACLLLRTLHDLSYSDIAALLDIAEGTAMSHVHRSKLKMRRRLAPSGSSNQPPTKP